MGFLFTLLYIVTAFLTPDSLFGPLAEYHLELLIAGLAVVFSIPNVAQSGVLKTPQAFAVAAFSVAIFASLALTGWFGGGVQALYGCMQAEVVFFLVAINCAKKRHLKILVLALFLCSTLFILLGARDLHDQVIPSVYLFGDGTLRRIRGLGFVNDPNDLGQVLVSLVPAIFLWKRPGVFLNIFVVGVPLSVLLVGLYLTHSRGGIVALAAVVLIAARRKFGTLPAALGAGSLFAIILAAGGSGGRDVSVDAGADRIDLWAAGLAMIKTHPLFGVGFGGFVDANGITAHNSVVICAAELGIVGLFFWVMFLFSSVRDAVCHDRLARDQFAEKVVDVELPAHLRQSSVPVGLKAEPVMVGRDTLIAEAFTSNFRHSPTTAESHRGISAVQPVTTKSIASPILPRLQNAIGRSPLDQAKRLTPAEVSGIIRILITSMTGFLVAGWFLSRAISMWLFMYCGMLYAASHMGTEIGLTPHKDSIGFTFRWSLAVTLGLLVVISIIIRLRNFGI